VREPTVAVRRATRIEGDVVAKRLAPLFFVSGVAALAYQVCWQRLLFAAFGVDIDSVTIIVSVFMLGLGLGALLGGDLADRRPAHALRFFAMAELGIGIFGVFSPTLIRATGDAFVGAPQWQTAIANFVLLLAPTCLMGATLPILVAHVTRLWGNVGKSIGLLYQVNTFGAAFGVAFVGFVWLLFFDLDDAIRTAAILNVAVSVTTVAWMKRHG
jgi:predicted membrane-bound spermidine synthase